MVSEMLWKQERDEHGQRSWLFFVFEDNLEVEIPRFVGQDIPGIVKVIGKYPEPSTNRWAKNTWRLEINENARIYSGSHNWELVEFDRAIAEATFSPLPRNWEDLRQILKVSSSKEGKVKEFLRGWLRKDAAKFDNLDDDAFIIGKSGKGALNKQNTTKLSVRNVGTLNTMGDDSFNENSNLKEAIAG